MSIFAKKFDSVRQDWTTPKALFDRLNAEFSFQTDLAASKENALCPKFFTAEDNGLKQVWSGSCWLNPPYGDKTSKMVDWIKKAYEDTQKDPSLTVVMLIPARTNTRWFHGYCMKAAEVRFILGRPKFGDAIHGLPQPLAFIVFKKSDTTVFTTFKL